MAKRRIIPQPFGLSKSAAAYYKVLAQHVDQFDQLTVGKLESCAVKLAALEHGRTGDYAATYLQKDLAKLRIQWLDADNPLVLRGRGASALRVRRIQRKAA